MEQILPEHWAILHLGLVFSITLAQLLVLYVLSDAPTPPAGQGLFTVYFMAALLGWIAVTLQQRSGTPLVVDVPSVASILNSYILFMAAGERAGVKRGRIPLGALCLVGCLSVFFLSAQQMFATQGALATLFFGAAGALFTGRAIAQRNVGDAIMAYACVLMVVGMPAALYQQYSGGDPAQVQTISFAVYSCAYTLVAIGFLASVLTEYQQHMSHMAIEDPLTRLLNRRGMEDALHVSLARAARSGGTIAAVAVDIDHFRRVNDSFGQDTGDQVLRNVARIIERQCRTSDVVARTGGEEFLLVLPDTDIAGARLLAERIRGAVGDQPMVIDQQRIPVTVSLGVAAGRGEIRLDELAGEAGRAMYLAKRGGHNRVAAVDNRPVHLTTTGAEG